MPAADALFSYATDAAARRHLISNAQQLLRLTRGRHVVLSSGARHPMELRGPDDAVNL